MSLGLGLGFMAGAYRRTDNGGAEGQQKSIFIIDYKALFFFLVFFNRYDYNYANMMPSSPSSSTYSGHIASPTTTMTSTPSEPDNTTTNNSLDDIFGSSPGEQQQHIPTEEIETTRPHSHAQLSATNTAEPSDLPSLRRQHVTAGYRDGIAYSKGENVQAGFDGGYPVGAQFGLRAGTILGILEGVVSGLESTSSGSGPVKKKTMTKRAPLRGSTKNNTEDSLGTEKGEETQETQIHRQKIERIKQLYKNALKELDVEALFGGLKADVQEGEGQGPDFTEEMKPENRLRQKADPAVARWEKLVDVTRWEESMEAIDSMEDHNVDADEKELK
jgi:Essential protein Yae1, N terminal